MIYDREKESKLDAKISSKWVGFTCMEADSYRNMGKWNSRVLSSDRVCFGELDYSEKEGRNNV